MRVNYHLWSGVARCARGEGHIGTCSFFPTLVVDVNLMDWALPLSLHLGGPLLAKPGVTFRIGPINIGWSIL